MQEHDTRDLVERLATPGRRSQPLTNLEHTVPKIVPNAHKKQAYWDMFLRIMNSPCQNHGFPVTHLAKGCVTYQRHVALEAQKRMDQDWYSGNCDDNEDTDAATRCSMLIFCGPQA